MSEMSSTMIKTPILPGKYYHIFNQGNNGEQLFSENSDYLEFLKKYERYVGEYCDTLAYCLLPNHFHLLVKVNEPLMKTQLESVSSRYRVFFQQYAQYFNKKNDRKGSLFRKYFRRTIVETADDLRRIVFYIHHNPQKHGYIQRFQDYYYSSYKALISDKPSKLGRETVLSWFNHEVRAFINFHTTIKDDYMIRHIILEEL